MLAPHTGTIYITEAEYLDGEKRGKARHEYRDGKVYAMAGTTKRHNRIALNVVRHLPLEKADGTPCAVHSSDIKVRAGQGRAFYYPDVVVSCSEESGDDYYLEHPCLIVEVTSKSTEWKDYNEKLLVYQSIASLQAYLVLAQDKPYATLFYREAQGSWWVNTYESLSDEVILPCPDCTLPLSVVYGGLEFLESG